MRIFGNSLRFEWFRQALGSPTSFYIRSLQESNYGCFFLIGALYVNELIKFKFENYFLPEFTRS